MTCEKCGTAIQIGDFPFCPHGRGANGVIPDDIPGGLVIEHGIPGKYYSRTEINREAKRRGYTNLVEHKPPRGSDKSPHTTRWI